MIVLLLLLLLLMLMLLVGVRGLIVLLQVPESLFIRTLDNKRRCV